MAKTGRGILALSFILLFAVVAPLRAQGTIADYQRAEKLLPANLYKIVPGSIVEPHWLGESQKYWFICQTRGAKQFRLVNAAALTNAPLFDHDRLAAALAKATGKKVDAANLPLTITAVSDDLASIDFRAFGGLWRYQVADGSCTEVPAESGKPVYFPSPDGVWEAYVENFNLFIRRAGGGEERQLTSDGSAMQPWATEVPGPQLMVRAGKEEIAWPTDLSWSPDSRRLLVGRLDVRDAGKLTFVQATPASGSIRSQAYSYYYPQPGETNVPTAEMFVFERESGARVKLAIEPLPILYYGGPWPLPQWNDDGSAILFANVNRGWTDIKVQRLDPVTGAARTLFEEHSDTCMDPGNGLTLREIDHGRQLIWRSDRDGHDHLYRFDARSGALLGQVTTGDWNVLQLLEVDETAGCLYFIGVGRETGRDPYLRNLYRCNFDGGDLRLLTPEDADHTIYWGPDGTFFVDTASNVDGETVTRLCDRDGKPLLELNRADISALTELGWVKPEPFVLPGRDGQTPIYGVIVRPTTFDPARTYPIIDEVYSGPHHVQAPKTLAAYLRVHGQSIAELGFIVVYIDGMGTANRSKAFQDVSYKNLVDGGFPDHIAVIKQLAAQYPYMDASRVGVYGYSAGGYNTAQALLSFGDFYSVGVAASGNYDHRIDKAWWNELWMGYPLTQPYIDQSCITMAGNLKGKLMIAVGELDDNVPPYSAFRFADALQKANKDFEFLVVPNAHHNLTLDRYFLRKRWDFFVRNLLGIEPPKEYLITSLN